jgi:hypothetical protein
MCEDNNRVLNENLVMLRKIHGTNFFHIKLLDRPNIKCQNKPVLPPAQVFYFNGQALHNIFATRCADNDNSL